MQESCDKYIFNWHFIECKIPDYYRDFVFFFSVSAKRPCGPIKRPCGPKGKISNPEIASSSPRIYKVFVHSFPRRRTNYLPTLLKLWSLGPKFSDSPHIDLRKFFSQNLKSLLRSFPAVLYKKISTEK